MQYRRPMIEGTIAGVLGAATVALWFLMVDAANGHPLFTPAVLGASLFDSLGLGADGSLVANVTAYTLFHFATFIALGIAIAAVVRAADRKPSLGFLLFGIFVAFEAGFLALTWFMSRSPLYGEIAWWQFGIANLLAAAVMGRHIWRAYHPTAEDKLMHAMEART